MGSLAKWGAVAGGAKAMGEHLVRKEEQAQELEKMSFDEARRARLQKIREGGMDSRQTQRQEWQGGENEATREFRAGEREADEGFAAGQAEKKAGADKYESEIDRQFEAVQLDKKLASQEKVAGMRASASGKSSTEGKWKITKVKGAGSTDPETGMPMEGGERIAITSPDTGNTFVQDGARFVPQAGADLEIKQPRAANRDEAMEELYANPEKWAELFLNEYNWLPSSLMKYIPK